MHKDTLSLVESLGASLIPGPRLNARAFRERGISVSARVNYRTGYIDHRPGRSRRRRWLRKWDHNLIVDSGLDSVAARTWCQSFGYAAAGSGTNPTERDSGAITVTATAGALVASANYFEAADVGRLLRLDSGEQGYITAYTDPQNATWSGVDAAASPGTIYYVNRTQLQTELKRTNTYRTSSGDCSSTWGAVNGEWTHQRTYLFSVEAGAVTYREVGWSWGANPTNLFGIDVLSGGGDSLVAGQQYLIVVQVVLRLSPTTSTTAPDVGSGGWNTEGDISLGDIRAGGDGGGAYPLSAVSTSGSSSGGSTLEPSAMNCPCHYLTGVVTLPSASNAQVNTPVGSDLGNTTADAYVSGSFTRTARIVAGVSSANTTWTGIAWARTQSGGAPYSCVAAVAFDAGQLKDNVHTVTVVWRLTWNRRF